MTQEEKNLLLKDLCGRQMYDVKCQVFNDAKPYTLSGVLHNKPHSQLYFEELDWKEYDGFVNVEYCKPYLFPLSSMTEEQIKEVLSTKHKINLSSGKVIYLDSLNTFEFYNKNHIDYCELIPMGLANDATNLNIYIYTNLNIY